MFMSFNDRHMGIEVGVPFCFRDWNSDQKLFEEIMYQCRLPVDDRISIDICKQNIIKRVLPYL